ncbi:MAG: hypothetical protein A3F83_02490 [Candidatus Glassbacteria bacterium RIFCSPLOWO2_12_FULL_58_11]|uniref:Gfo/Idh/MocA-like oxidoreductase N-terminal domain-containing protein n=1 Tax=Candidatus Glassbacteria bacterium RIFCSPLOWO2_12_FULL_58_11 TaxID=1817867 RepID=A0A1F5YPL9_9BACT|nr:MAG: hypothetical protein A3F83_02490 [Candidatus Glassbacteria bacterium RIFCSPLOWO2_12_FULL_58_11]
MQNIDRRTFVKRSGGAVAATLSLASATLLKAQGANDRINVGVIGTGSRGCYLIDRMKNVPGVEITDVCDIYPPSLAEGLKQAGGKARTHKDHRKLLEMKEIDVAFVVTPLVYHVPQCLDALEAGKHIFCEKSMGYTVKECDRLVEATGKSGKVVQIGYGPHDARQKKIRELLTTGSIGRVTQIFSHYHRNSTWEREVPEPEWWKPLNWRLYWEYCGGLLTELVSHQLTALNWLLDSHPLSAVGSGGVDLYTQHERETWDHVNVVYDYPGGVRLDATAILSNARYGYSMTIMGTHGTIVMDRRGSRIYWEPETRHLDSLGVSAEHFKVQLGQSLKDDETPDESPGKVIETGEEDDRRESMIANFFNCVRENGHPAIDVQEGRRSSTTSLLGNRAIREGRKVMWDEMINYG